MSDYMAAEITLGGPVPYRLVGQLCLAIAAESAALEWGADSFLPVSPEDLLKARCEVNGALVLQLYTDEAAYGEFEVLEAFLQQHGLAYRRFSDAKYEFDAVVIEHRPAFGSVRYLASHNGEPLVSLARFRSATQAMEEAIGLLQQRRSTAAQITLADTLIGFYCDMPREVPPLESFEIVKGGRRVFHT